MPRCPIAFVVSSADRGYEQIVEELEDRFVNQIDEMLDVVRSSLSEPAAPPPVAPLDLSGHEVEEAGHAEETIIFDEYEVHDVEFDDTGEGAGVEGDLDVDDD